MRYDDATIPVKFSSYISLDKYVNKASDEIHEILDDIVDVISTLRSEYVEEIERLEERIDYLEELLDDNGIDYEHIY